MPVKVFDLKTRALKSDAISPDNFLRTKKINAFHI